MKTGTDGMIKSLDPIINITGTGKNTYLWVGNDHQFDKACFATLSGTKTLETFAINILKALKSKRLALNNS